MNETIDARQDLAGAVNALYAEIRALRAEQDYKRISSTSAAKLMGYSESYFRSYPWRIPDFGLKGTRHSLSAWKVWLEKPEAERRAEWDAMPVKDRRTARGLQ